MSPMIVKPPDDEHAYEQIEAAVMETGRGRWFLAEYARRNRHAETQTILQAIDKLQKSVGGRSSLFLPTERLQGEILEMARAISRTEREIRAIRPDGVAATHYSSASEELDSVVGTTEQATSTILSAAEKVQEYAWTMRERSGKEDECDLLDACATEIYTACGFQDLTAQRIRKVVTTLSFLDQRIKAILEAIGLAEDFRADEEMIGEHAEPEAVVRSSDIWMSDANQAEIDNTFDFFVPAEMVEPTIIGADLLDLAPPPPPRAAKSAASRSAAPSPGKSAIIEAGASLQPADPAGSTPLDAYAALSTEEKLRAFR